jgi:RNA recognition motif-containing protein
VFVGNVSFGTTEEQLRHIFSQAAEVVSLSVPTDRMTGRPRGFAFVEFATDEQAEAAIEKFDGSDLDGRRLRVNKAEERSASAAPRSFTSPDRFAARPPRPKGSRRNVRARKRSIW